MTKRRPTLAVAALLALAITTGPIASVDAAATAVTAGPPSTGAIALTFDDGGDRATCAQIADILRARRVKGTFFINGDYLRRDPAKWRRILKGMAVGNHTRSHLDLTRQPKSVMRKQIRRNERIHERVLGRRMVKMFRPPYGAHDRLVRIVAGRAGYLRTVLWSHDTLDWHPSATVSSVIARAIGGPPGSIILMHCQRSVTAAALPAIISHYRARGIRMLGLRRVLGL